MVHDVKFDGQQKNIATRSGSQIYQSDLQKINLQTKVLAVKCEWKCDQPVFENLPRRTNSKDHELDWPT